MTNFMQTPEVNTQSGSPNYKRNTFNSTKSVIADVLEKLRAKALKTQGKVTKHTGKETNFNFKLSKDERLKRFNIYEYGSKSQLK